VELADRVEVRVRSEAVRIVRMERAEDESQSGLGWLEVVTRKQRAAQSSRIPQCATRKRKSDAMQAVRLKLVEGDTAAINRNR